MKKQKKPVASAEAEPVIKKQPLLKRLLFGPEKPDLSELEAGSTTILDILSPTAIDTKSIPLHHRLWLQHHSRLLLACTAGGGGRGRQCQLQLYPPEPGKDPLQNCADHHAQPQPNAGCGRYPPGL